MNKHNKQEQEQNYRYRKQIVAGGKGIGWRKVGEGDEEVQTPSYKINKSHIWNTLCGEYSE